VAITKAEIDERQKFSSGGKTYWLILRGQWGVKVDRHVVRWTGFSLITWQYAKAHGTSYSPVVMLTTIGAKTGELRTQVLPYTELEGSYVVVGSNGGGPKDPAWVVNARADRNTWVRINGRRIPCLARIAAGEERERVLDHVAKVKPFTRNYDAETARNGRQLPLVILTPRTAAR
jgi:deazaflavin-dependent oxidoreductase (nitroreductase family)